jgi:trimethylamine:corrinoid methyltransferase-like protein
MQPYEMSSTPLHLERPILLPADDAARVHDLAKRILAEVGLEVRHEIALEALRARGLTVRDGRVLFTPAVVDEHVDEMRRQLRNRPRPSSITGQRQLTLSVSTYSLYVHDIETDQVVPYSTDRLIDMCKLVDSLADDGVWGAPPGIPMDVQPDLQPIAQYHIGALHARQGATPVDPTSAETVNHLLDMADVMGEPITSLPVYVPSPLRLGGESLDVVLACVDRLRHISVSSMPSAGATAPIHPFGALALAVAEVIGGMITVHILTQRPVSFSVGIFPFDLRAGAMIFGSPENMLFQMLCADLNRYYGYRWHPAPNNIHVMSKLPDSQAAAEKAAIMAAGTLMGAHHFSCAGTLSLDEIFSPEQLLIDCEIRDWAQRAGSGIWLGEEAVDDWLSEIEQGVKQGFMQLDSTLDTYMRHVWYPRRFERGAIGRWLTAGRPRLRDRLHAEIRGRIADHDFELDADRRRELQRIYSSAQSAVGV